MSELLRRPLACVMAVVLAFGTVALPRDAHAAYEPASLAAGASRFGDEWATVIVELDGQPQVSSASGMGTMAVTSKSVRARVRHALLQSEIGDLVGGSASGGSRYAPLSVGSEPDSFTVVADYYNVIDGFAVTAPVDALDDIRNLDGVASAFVEHAYTAPEDAEDTHASVSGEQSNAQSLAMTGADNVSQTGAGQVIAIIDTGVEVTHQAFSGDMDEDGLAWTSDSIASAKSRLSQGGKDAAYVNAKIPFAWDYGDNDPDPHGINNHGTHVAGIAVANAGETRGTAPGAQLLAMRVARDRDGAMIDTAILAALDDAAVLEPDVINMSLGSDGGFFDDATNIYSTAFKNLEAAGCTLCISAGNAYYSTYRDAGNLPLASHPDVGTIASPSAHAESFSVASADNADVASGEAVHMSSFSSWGPTPELKMKPEITGPGGNIYSSVYNDDYDNMSGTSMSSPHVAGLAALVSQYVSSDAKFAGLSAADKHDRVTQLLMNTAVPIANPKVAGSFASPRHQGSGLANVEAATRTEVYATVQGADDPSRPKAELGSSASGSWDFTVVFHNMGGNEARFEPAVCALTDRVVGGRLQMSPSDHAGDDIQVSCEGATYADGCVTVPANGEAALTVHIACSDDFRRALAEQGAVNGAYVEGFARFLAQDGGVDLSVPYLGFCGAYDEVPAFDAFLGSGNSPQVYATRLVSRSGNSLHVLGTNPLVDAPDSSADFDRIVISHANLSRSNPSCAYVAEEVVAAPSSLSVQTGLLRNAAKMSYIYRDSAGNEVARYEYSNVTRSMTQGYSYPEADLSVPVFTGYDARGEALPDGEYTLEEVFEPAVSPSGEGGPATQSQTFRFYLDTAAPEVTGLAIEGEGDDAKLVVTVADDTFLAAVDLVPLDAAEQSGRGSYYRFDATNASWSSDGGKNAYRFELSLAEAQAAYEQAGFSGALSADELAVCAWDYGLNWTRTSEAGAADDFVVEDGVLSAYHGRDLNVVIPDGVTAIGGRAFYNSRVRSVTIPASVRKICDEAFYQATALSDVTIENTAAAPSKLTFIGVRAFSGSGIKSIDIPDTVNSIGKQAFSNTAFARVSAGAKARIDVSTFHAANPTHLVMRGAKSYAASYEAAHLDMRPMETAFFGEGVKKIEFYSAAAPDAVSVQRDDYSEEFQGFFDSGAPSSVDADEKVYGIAPPKTIVIPSTCTTLALTPDQAKVGMPGYSVQTLVRYDPSSVTIYAPKGSTGWKTAEAALKSIGADPAAQLVPFSAISAETLDSMGASGLAVAADEKLKQTISVSKSSYSVKTTDAAFPLSAKSSAQGAKLSYATSDAKVAKVSTAGKVTPVGAGKATITVTAKADGYEPATCQVKVTVALASQTLTVTKAAVSKTMGAQAFSLGAKSSVKGAQLAYASANKKVATVSSKGVVTLKGAGTCKITVTSTVARYKQATKTVTVTVALAKPALAKATKSSKPGKLTASWKSIKGAQGYQLKVGSKIYTCKGVNAVSKTVSAAKGKTVKVKVRAYSKASGKMVYSAWSAAKNVKVKK